MNFLVSPLRKELPCLNSSCEKLGLGWKNFGRCEFKQGLEANVLVVLVCGLRKSAGM